MIIRGTVGRLRMEKDFKGISGLAMRSPIQIEQYLFFQHHGKQDWFEGSDCDLAKPQDQVNGFLLKTGMKAFSP